MQEEEEVWRDEKGLYSKVSKCPHSPISHSCIMAFLKITSIWSVHAHHLHRAS